MPIEMRRAESPRALAVAACVPRRGKLRAKLETNASRAKWPRAWPMLLPPGAGGIVPGPLLVHA
jgi:hypothetical protein